MIRRRPLPEHNKPGRKTLYTADIPVRVAFLATRGFTNNDIARALGVSIQCVEHWQRTREDFRVALQQGKNEFDNRVEHAFYELAVGYSHPDVYITQYKGDVITVPIIKHYPPNAWAAYKWLTIRCRDRWADVHKAEITNTLNIKHIDFSDFTDEELRVLEEVGMKRLLQTNLQ